MPMTKKRPVRVSCDQCQLLRINGIVCHEIGCPNQPRQCKNCDRTMRQGQREFCNNKCHHDYYA